MGGKNSRVVRRKNRTRKGLGQAIKMTTRWKRSRLRGEYCVDYGQHTTGKHNNKTSKINHGSIREQIASLLRSICRRIVVRIVLKVFKEFAAACGLERLAYRLERLSLATPAPRLLTANAIVSDTRHATTSYTEIIPRLYIQSSHYANSSCWIIAIPSLTTCAQMSLFRISCC